MELPTCIGCSDNSLQPCSNPVIRGSRYCEEHGITCRSRYRNYKKICNSVDPDTACDSSTNVESMKIEDLKNLINELIRRRSRLKSCHDQRIEFKNRCITPEYTDIGHETFLDILEERYTLCESLLKRSFDRLLILQRENPPSPSPLKEESPKVPPKIAPKTPPKVKIDKKLLQKQKEEEFERITNEARTLRLTEMTSAVRDRLMASAERIKFLVELLIGILSRDNILSVKIIPRIVETIILFGGVSDETADKLLRLSIPVRSVNFGDNPTVRFWLVLAANLISLDDQWIPQFRKIETLINQYELDLLVHEDLDLFERYYRDNLTINDLIGLFKVNNRSSIKFNDKNSILLIIFYRFGYLRYLAVQEEIRRLGIKNLNLILNSLFSTHELIQLNQWINDPLTNKIIGNIK